MSDLMTFCVIIFIEKQRKNKQPKKQRNTMDGYWQYYRNRKYNKGTA